MSDAGLIVFSIVVVGALIIWAYIYNTKFMEFSKMEQIKLKAELQKQIDKSNWEHKQQLRMLEKQKYYELEKMRLELLPGKTNDGVDMEQMVAWLQMFKDSKEEVKNKDNNVQGTYETFISKFTKLTPQELMLKYPDVYEVLMRHLDDQVIDGELVK